MKILMCLYSIQDLGGIINHAEHMIYGLKQLGHDVTLVRLENKKKLVNSSTKRPVKPRYSGIPTEQRGGWAFPMENRVAAHSVNWKKYVEPYDLILWEVPIPPKGWYNYDFLYDIDKPQIPIIHDGNAVKMYPHIMNYEHKFEYFACVHPCAMGNMKELGAKNTRLIVNPQAELNTRLTEYSTTKKRNILSLQTFKAWKHVEDLVGSIPYTTRFNKCLVAGGGIEYYYMTSKDKRKPKYGTMWEEAIEHGMNYIGYITEEERDKILRSSKLLIDTSYSKTYKQYGSHFNRVMVDAIISGCVPVVRDWAMENNGVFKKDEHHFEIPVGIDYYDFAGYIDEYLTTPNKECRELIRNAQSIVKRKFDAKVVARSLLK